MIPAWNEEVTETETYQKDYSTKSDQFSVRDLEKASAEIDDNISNTLNKLNAETKGNNGFYWMDMLKKYLLDAVQFIILLLIIVYIIRNR